VESREFLGGESREMENNNATNTNENNMNVENQKVLAGEGQDSWWRRQVGSNHTPQGGANQLSGDGHNLMASTSQSYRQNNSIIGGIKNNLSNKGEVVSGPISENVTPPDKYYQYSTADNFVKGTLDKTTLDKTSSFAKATADLQKTAQLRAADEANDGLLVLVPGALNQGGESQQYNSQSQDSECEIDDVHSLLICECESLGNGNFIRHNFITEDAGVSNNSLRK
jgi:hypothetical protein